MRNPTGISIIFVFLIFTFTDFSSSQVSLSTSHFDIFASTQDLAQEVKNTLESSYKKISGFLEDSLSERVSVFVANTEEEFLSMVGSNFPDWGIGCAIPDRNLIVLKSPYRFKYHRPFSQVVTHELAHIFLGKLSGKAKVPRWLDEGFAMYQSHEWRIGQDLAVARAVLTGSILPLSQIETVNAFQESKAQLAYTESFLAVSYLYQEYGEGTVKELVTHLASGTSIDLAFLRTIGSNYLSFQLEFEKFIKGRYNWISFLGDTFLIWIGLAFFIVFLYLLKKRHTKKTLKEWELEEEGIKRLDEFSDDKTSD